MERCEDDMFYVYTEMRVALREPEKYVLITDPAQALDDPREAILLQPRQECVTNNLVGGLMSFDLTDTDSASWRLYSQLEQSVYHMTCFDVTATLQPDGSLLLQTVGDASEMQNLYDDGMVILTALTLTDRTGQNGRIEVFYQYLPATPHVLNSVTYQMPEKVEGFDLKHACLYYLNGYAYFSAKFNLDGELTTPDAARLTASDYPAANGLMSSIALHRDEYIHYSSYYPEIINNQYYHVLFRLDGVDTLTEIFYPTLTFLAGGEEAFTVSLVSPRVGDTHGPTATPTAPPTVTPSPTIPPDEFTIPEASEALASYTLEIVDKPQMYSHYSAKLRVHNEGYVLQPYFRYHTALPEGSYLRLVAVNGETGDYGSGIVGLANLTSGPQDLLTARICLPSLPAAKCTFLLEAVDPASDAVIFSLTLKSQSAIQAIPSSTGTSGSGYNILDGLIGNPAPTVYSPTYNYYYNNYGWNYGSGSSWIEEGMQIQTPNPYGGGFGW